MLIINKCSAILCRFININNSAMKQLLTMEQVTINSSSDNISLNSFKRLADIPLVHKPSVSGLIQATKSTESITHCKSYCSYFCKHLEREELPARPSTVCGVYRPCECLPKSSTDPESEKPRTEEPETSPRSDSVIPVATWIQGGILGSRNSFLIFRSCALAGANRETIQSKPAYKLHVTYKVMQAETKLLAKLLECHGVTEVPHDFNDFNLVWTGNHPKPGLFRSLCSHQRINHFPRSYELTRKDRLYKNIERMQHSKGLRNFDFIPQTFIMPGDFKELCSVHYRIRGPWIVKPVASSRGRGIFIVETPYQVPLDEPVVVAKYISNPLLVDGHKCDLRLYVAVTSYDPLLIYIYEEGLVRFATVKYDVSHKQLWNPCMHLCNYSINKYHSDYIKSDDPCAENVGHKWTLSALLRHLKSQNKDTVQLMAQIEDIVVKAIITSANSIVSACHMFVPNQNNCFELFGFDILVDEDLKAWLLEVNLSPSLGCDSPLDVRLKSAMLADLLTLVGLPAVDPMVKSLSNDTTVKTSNLLKMKLTSCRRVHSADGLSHTSKKNSSANQNGRLACSTFCLSPEETRIVKLARSQFERRGGWVRIFPTADSWCKYSQYLDSTSGIPLSSMPSATSCHLVVQHNYNNLLHSQLFPNIPKVHTSTKNAATVTANPKVNKVAIVAAVGQRHNRYERQLTRGHKTTLDPNKHAVSKSHGEEIKPKICEMLKSGKILTQGEARRTFSQYLGCILRRISTNSDTEQESHIDIVLKFLQKASAYLRTPFVVKVPSSKLAGKDRAAIVAKQLNDFLYLYNRETELYSDTVDRLNSIPNKLYSEFLESARENDLEEILTMHTVRNLPQRQVSTSCAFQGFLKCLPNVNLNHTKTIATNRNMTRTIAKPS